MMVNASLCRVRRSEKYPSNYGEVTMTVANLRHVEFGSKALIAFAVSLAAATVAQAGGKGEGFVDIVAWPGYIERGETDKAYDWVTSFEKETGCQVRVKSANTSDEMVALMNEGGFDLVTASGDASLRLVAGGRV